MGRSILTKSPYSCPRWLFYFSAVSLRLQRVCWPVYIVSLFSQLRSLRCHPASCPAPDPTPRMFEPVTLPHPAARFCHTPLFQAVFHSGYCKSRSMGLLGATPFCQRCIIPLLPFFTPTFPSPNESLISMLRNSLRLNSPDLTDVRNKRRQ